MSTLRKREMFSSNITTTNQVAYEEMITVLSNLLIYGTRTVHGR